MVATIRPVLPSLLTSSPAAAGGSSSPAAAGGEVHAELTTFVEALQLARKGKVRFSLAGACRTVESIFDLAYLKNVFEMAPDANRLISGE